MASIKRLLYTFFVWLYRVVPVSVVGMDYTTYLPPNLPTVPAGPRWTVTPRKALRPRQKATTMSVGSGRDVVVRIVAREETTDGRVIYLVRRPRHRQTFRRYASELEPRNPVIPAAQAVA